jgi:hypothetical protein
MASLYDEALDHGVVEPEPVEEVEEEEQPISNPEYNLLYRGHNQTETQIGQHTIRLRTLRIGEELEATLLAEKYKDTAEYPRALMTAMVAASIVSVDNKPLIGSPLGPQEESVTAKFDYLMKHWYWVTVRDVFAAYNDMLGQTLAIYESVKKD